MGVKKEFLAGGQGEVSAVVFFSAQRNGYCDTNPITALEPCGDGTRPSGAAGTR